MQVLSLSIRRFRNLASLAWEPAPGLNLIYGRNGQGKTNVIEALHFALLGRSFRTRQHQACLPWQAQQAPAPEHEAPTQVEVRLARRVGERQLRLMLGPRWKRCWLDGQLLGRLGDLWAEAAVVCFTPEHVGLFKGPPSERRRWLDMELSLTSRSYLVALQQYGQALRQVNAAYKRAARERRGSALQEARSFYATLVQAGAILVAGRAERLAAATEDMRQPFAALGGDALLLWGYDPLVKELSIKMKTKEIERVLHQKLEGGEAEGVRQGRCLQGPHRDDFYALLGGQDLRAYGSQGQHRLVTLALQLDSARRMGALRDDPPIVLLDDFGSELDPGRRASVLQALRGKMQVFVTATHPDDLGPEALFDTSRCLVAGAWAQE